MALNYYDLLKTETETPFSSDELKVIDEVEAFIDEEIKKQWTSDEVLIDLRIADFSYTTGLTSARRKYNKFRREKMMENLLSRYSKAEWKTEIKYDMDGPDYLVLTPKKRKS